MQFWLFGLFLSHDISKTIRPNLLQIFKCCSPGTFTEPNIECFLFLFFFEFNFFFVSQLSENFDLFLKKSVKFDYFAKYWRYVQKGNLRFCKNLLFNIYESFRIIQLTVSAVSCDKWNTRKHAFCGTAGPRGPARIFFVLSISPIFYMWLYKIILVTLRSLSREFFLGGGTPLSQTRKKQIYLPCLIH